MNGSWLLAAFAVGVVVAATVAFQASRHPFRAVVRENYAGRRVAVVLGAATGAGFLIGVAVPYVGGLLSGREYASWGPGLWGAVGALTAAGVIDDRYGGHPRGIRDHLLSFFRGRPTTGILKLVVGVAMAVIWAMVIEHEIIAVITAALLIAASINVWNALDVRPGRALKWAGVAMVGILAFSWDGPFGIAAAATLGAVVGTLPFDLREVGMLGDAGSNPLGFLVGTGLAAALPKAGLITAAVAVLFLQLVAETVTISRLIEAVPPLRWFDRLGRES